MPSVQELLHAAGIGLEASSEPPGLRSDCARLAAAVRRRNFRALGLVPAGDDVAVPGPALALGRALADVSPRSVGVVDALGSWPCAQALLAHAAHDGTPEARSWVLDRLAVLTPRTSPAGAALGQLRAGLADRWTTFDHLVVDLTGLDHLGEHVAAYALLDAVALVARSGRTTTSQVRRGLREVPDGRALGVLLTGL